jgi:hypothetical protein
MILEVLQLAPHPDMPPRAVPSVACSLSWQDPGHWAAGFIVGAAPDALALPAAVMPSRADGLWQRTCFELFLRDPDTGGYLEFNFSPSGEWAAYRFDGYRAGMRPLPLAEPWITSTQPDQFNAGMGARLAALGLDAASIETMLNIPMPALPKVPAAPTQYALNAYLDDSGLADAPFRELAISAVIEEADGTKSYWALTHPTGKPDFHASESFALTL